MFPTPESLPAPALDVLPICFIFENSRNTAGNTVCDFIGQFFEIPKNGTHGQSDGRIDRRTDRQADGQGDRQTERQTDTHTDTRTHRHTHRQIDRQGRTINSLFLTINRALKRKATFLGMS
jgi:hypothetical protein